MVEPSASIAKRRLYVSQFQVGKLVNDFGRGKAGG